MNVEYRTVTLRARSKIVGSDLDAAVLDNELRRHHADGWQLVSAFNSKIQDTTESRYFVLFMCRHRR